MRFSEAVSVSDVVSFNIKTPVEVFNVKTLARCLVSKMVKNGYKSVFAYLSPKWASLTNAF